MESLSVENPVECHPQQFHYVYILQCADNSHYIGCTSDLLDRINRHNFGQVAYTKTRLPVKVIFTASFPDKYKAYEFEKYLKSGSGRAFTKKHLI
jgi:predicted GIY-YIG superfamily endonuclease